MSTNHPLLETCDPSTCTAAKIAWVQRNIHSIYRKHLLPFDITNSQLSMLFVLSKMGGLKQIDLCQILALEKSTVSRNLTRLMKNNLLIKNASRELFITDSGKSLLEQIIPSWEKAKAEVADIIGPSGQQALDQLISKIAAQ